MFTLEKSCTYVSGDMYKNACNSTDHMYNKLGKTEIDLKLIEKLDNRCKK